MQGDVAYQARRLLFFGADYGLLERAVEAFVERHGRTAFQLAEIYAELGRESSPSPSERPSLRRRANDWVDEHGWPTGARFVRGTHSGSYVYDPLGTDRVPYPDWPHRKPSFDEICTALRLEELLS